MTSAMNAPTEFQARGWVLWLTWTYVVLFGIGTLFGVAALILGGKLFGLEMRGPDQITVFWVLLQVPYIAFAVGCVGVLLRDRDFGWAAVIAAWVIAIVQGVQALLQLAHLRLSIPLGAFLFVAYAIGMTRLLRPAPARDSRIGQGMI